MCVQADPTPVTCEGYDPLTGQYNKDVLPFSPTRPADPTVYHFTEVSGHHTRLPCRTGLHTHGVIILPCSRLCGGAAPVTALGRLCACGAARWTLCPTM
jgi:hypothetical protein